MAMVFCRGCGKEIHETAILCPHCGCQLSDSSLALRNKNLWMAVVSFIFAIFSISYWSDLNTWSHDIKLGLWIFSTISIVLSVISLSQKHRGKIINIVSIGIASITILFLIEKMGGF